MPVLLMPDEYDSCLHGDLDTGIALHERCFPDELVEMTRTDERWVKREPAAPAASEAPSLF